MQTTDIDDVLNHSQISQLMGDWGLWRDTCNWAQLAGCYTADATMLTTWFDGPARDFVEASKRMASGGASVQHYVGRSTIRVHGEQALAVTRVELLVRGQLDGIAVDANCYARFYDRLLKQDGKWLISRRVPVYEKDCIRPVEPSHSVVLDAGRLRAFPAHYRYLAYLQSSGGASITPDLPAPNSPAEHALRTDDSAWLFSSSLKTLETTP